MNDKVSKEILGDVWRKYIVGVNYKTKFLGIDSSLWQGCIMFSWLFAVYMDIIMKKENGRDFQRKGENGDCLSYA